MQRFHRLLFRLLGNSAFSLYPQGSTVFDCTWHGGSDVIFCPDYRDGILCRLALIFKSSAHQLVNHACSSQYGKSCIGHLTGLGVFANNNKGSKQTLCPCACARAATSAWLVSTNAQGSGLSAVSGDDGQNFWQVCLRLLDKFADVDDSGAGHRLHWRGCTRGTLYMRISSLRIACLKPTVQAGPALTSHCPLLSFFEHLLCAQIVQLSPPSRF